MELKSVISHYNGRYDIYLPDVVKLAYKCILYRPSQIPPQRKAKIELLNLFSIVDEIFNESNQLVIVEGDIASNSIIQFHSWIHGHHS